jgi:methyl-accepting chemotaxis protein
VNSTAEAFKTVGAGTAKVSELVSEVAEASKEQSQGIGQVTTAMSEMDKVTQGNAATAEQSASAAGQLSIQAGNLLSVVKEMDVLAHGADSRLGSGSRRQSLAAPKKPTPVASRTAPAPATASNNKALPMDADEFDF